MKIIKEDELKNFITDEELRKLYNVNIKDTRLNELLAYYTFFKSNAGLVSLDKQSTYYSMYFWFVQFKERYFEVYGHDEGIEQEGFKLLEEIDYQLEENVDWGLIERIELKAI
ncbi:hypothetical protein M3201_23180 [Paenibacillus motobuensis]|uniref:hypothetical protein n=1 Tax=Paenibacillus TaxID=44249 RepID=UPI00203BA6D3|nr:MULTISPECIES: hypothetical protein [Paenibacillus]MCM3042562.1 hypothetical protein [Paenibacillus lutimineralis]MCM3649666.1 hypothetical protein [Paenibacillus motobuensis]